MKTHFILSSEIRKIILATRKSLALEYFKLPELKKTLLKILEM